MVGQASSLSEKQKRKSSVIYYNNFRKILYRSSYRFLEIFRHFFGSLYKNSDIMPGKSRTHLLEMRFKYEKKKQFNQMRAQQRLIRKFRL